MVPQKASGGGRGEGRIPHFNWSIYRGGNFFFLNPGLNWTRNRLRMVSKVRNFWLCVFSGVVATTLIPCNFQLELASLYSMFYSELS